MNKCFKSLWNEARHAYVAASEVTRARGKRSKSSIAVSATLALAAGMASTGASAAYVETGVIGDAASWETAEYQKDWGLGAMHSSAAYSLGFNGSGTLVAVMDSGALLSHPELSDGRITGTHVTGTYGSTGNRYPQSAADDGGQPYTKGEAFDVTGDWMAGVNDSHGTHVTGSVGASRDGSEFHGVAYGANVIVGNTGATDSNNYGPYQDHDYFYAGWKALSDALVEANGEKRGGVINNSWGTNTRIKNQGTVYGPDGGNVSVHIPANTVAESEYEYFYSDKMYGGGASFVDAAYEAVKDTNVVQIFTTGNRDMKNPFYRPLYPYFNPEAESQWIAVAGLGKAAGYTDESPKYKLMSTWNEAGLAKYWTVAAPGSQIYGSKVDTKTGDAFYGNSSGTSMSAPHVAGAMGVLMSRYQDMTAPQVRNVMFTTANHKNADGTDMEGWANTDGTTPAEGEVSDRMGWGVPDLEKGMYGPGQLLGQFDYDMSTTSLDVWTNDISEAALKQREAEDLKWMADTKNGTDIEAGGDYELGNSFIVNDGDDDDTNHIIDIEDAKKLRAAYYAKRAAAIQAKIDGGLYQGSLVKKGDGTLVMTGSNAYTGGTSVEAGSLYGFTESFGTAPVEVKGGSFGLIGSYNDAFTGKGELTASADPAQKAQVVVDSGATYVISAGEDVQAKSLEFKDGSLVTVGSLSEDVIEKAIAGETLTGSVTAEDGIKGSDLFTATPDYAFFDTEVKAEDNVLSASLKKSDATYGDYAENGNAASVGGALAVSDGALAKALTTGTKDDVRKTLSSLGNDLHLSANQSSIVNTVTLARTVKDQATGYGDVKSAELADGNARLWVAGIGSWSTLDRSGSDMDSDFYAALAGLEANVNESHKIGLFAGGGETKFKAGADGKINSDDLHFGVYGQSSFEPVKLSYGFIYSHQDRDSKRDLQLGANRFATSGSYDVQVTQLYGEVAWTGYSVSGVSIEPYAGLSWMRLKADSVTENAGGTAVKTEFDTQNLGALSIGARAAADFELGGIAFRAKGDLGWTQFMGDRRAKGLLKIGDEASATLKSEKLEGLGTIGLGLEAQIAKSATLGVSYVGAFGSDVTSNGVFAKLKFAF